MASHRITLSRRLPVEAAAAWPYLTEPEKMNRWSRAKVRLIHPGDGGGPGGVGAVRQVRIEAGGREVVLTEAIERSEPPHTLVYRVVDAPLVRAHRGEITLDGHELRWDVELALASDLVALGAKRLIEKQLGESLDLLAEVVRGAPPLAHPPPRVLDDEPAGEDFARAREILEAQRVLADKLEREGDPKRWFSRVYEYVTDAQLGAVEARRVRHRRWVLRLIPRFHHYYVSNLERWQSGAAESQWRDAFSAMEKGRSAKDPAVAVFHGLKHGMIAHIEEDLPRALAEVWLEHYADRCDYARFRCDYLLMGPIFDGSALRLLDLMPRSWVPWYVRLLGANLPEVTDGIRRRRYYDVRRARRLAFERGARIAALLHARG